MKVLDRAFIAAGIASLSMLIAVSSCDDNGKSEEKPSKQTLEATIKQGVWKVTYSKEEREIEGNGVELYFSSDGSITAVSGTSTSKGMWSAFESKNGLKVNLELEDAEPFGDLNDDWVVVEQTESRLILVEVGVGRGKLDKLTLVKV